MRRQLGHHNEYHLTEISSGGHASGASSGMPALDPRTQLRHSGDEVIVAGRPESTLRLNHGLPAPPQLPGILSRPAGSADYPGRATHESLTSGPGAVLNLVMGNKTLSEGIIGTT